MIRKNTAGLRRHTPLPTSIKETEERISKVNAELTDLSRNRTELNRKIQQAKMKKDSREIIRLKKEAGDVSHIMKGWEKIKETLVAHSKKAFSQRRK